MTTPLGIGMIGHAFMGRAHSHAWRTAPAFFELPLQPRMVAVAGRRPEATAAAAAALGWSDAVTDWRELLERDDIDLIDICTPGDTHEEIAVAALQAGKHVLCEKPLANSVAEAERMVAAAAAAPELVAMCGFSYRRLPALTLARRIVADGRLGSIRQIRGQYLQDWLSSPDVPLTWRLDRTKSGSGSLGDIGAHILDAAQWISGKQIVGVSALLETFVAERPLAGELVGLGGSAEQGAPKGPVTVDDAALLTARFEGGAIGIFEATRFALGHKNTIRLEINGTDASIAFDFTDMNALQFYDEAGPTDAHGFRRIDVTDAVHPYTGHWWPAGHGLGYEHGFVHQAVDLVDGIAKGVAPAPTFADALVVQRVLAAVESSAASASSYTAI